MLKHPNSDFLPPIQENDFLPSISHWTTFGGLFVVCVVCLAIPLASVTKYKVTVKAQALVRPAGGLRIVQALTEGPITHIWVKQNQFVKKGDVIATIDDSHLQTKKSQLQSNIQQTNLQVIQMNAQISALNSQLRAETTSIKSTQAQALAELSRRQSDYRDKLLSTNADVEEAKANVKIAQSELQKGQAELNLAEANYRSTLASFRAAESKRNRYQQVIKAGALSQNQLEEAELSAEQQQQAVSARLAAVSAQKQTIARLKQAIFAASARRKHAIAALDPSHAEVAIASMRITQQKATGEGSLATLDKERSALIKQRIEISKQLEQNKSEHQQLKTELLKTAVTATTDGIISQINLRNPGQTVRSGDEIVQIVPTNAPLEIKAAVAPQDKSKLKVGQNVQMRVSACSYPDYGTLKGKVKAISPDAVAPQSNGANTTDPTTAPSQKAATGGAFYEVTIEPERLSLEQGKNHCSLQLGMEGTADIISREETVLQFLLRKARLSIET